LSKDKIAFIYMQGKKGFAKLLSKPTLTKKACFMLNKGIRNGFAGLLFWKNKAHKK